MATGRFRIADDGPRYARFEGGVYVEYPPGSTVELTDKEQKKFTPGVLTLVTTDALAAEVKEQIAEATDKSTVQALLQSEKEGKGRVSVIEAAKDKLKELG